MLYHSTIGRSNRYIGEKTKQWVVQTGTTKFNYRNDSERRSLWWSWSFTVGEGTTDY